MRQSIRRTMVAALSLVALGTAGVAHAGSESGNFMVRVLGAGVIPDEKVDVTVGGATLRDVGDISDQWIPATTLTYFFTPNVSAELFCCVTHHSAKGTGAAAAFGEVGEMWLFPPTLTLQYHFTGLGGLKPYLGLGVTYINFFDEKSGGALVGTKFEVDSAWGLALQAGLDLSLGGGWYANADVKKILLDTDAKWTNAAGATVASAKVDLDPWIVSVGLGYRFNLDDVFGRRSTAPPLK